MLNLWLSCVKPLAILCQSLDIILRQPFAILCQSLAILCQSLDILGSTFGYPVSTFGYPVLSFSFPVLKLWLSCHKFLYGYKSIHVLAEFPKPRPQNKE